MEAFYLPDMGHIIFKTEHKKPCMACLMSPNHFLGIVDNENQSFGEAGINLMDDDSPNVTGNVSTVVPMDSTVRGNKRNYTIPYSDLMRECTNLASIASKNPTNAARQYWGQLLQ
jgi:hypothetical protein